MESCYFVVDLDRCWGCKSCQTACRLEHDLPPDSGWPIEVFRVENDAEGVVRCDFIPVLCLHCDIPACAAACPKDAIAKGADGVVRVDPECCVGCGLCEKACAYGCIQIDGVQNVAYKCDLCTERRGRGFLASCEQHCLGEAFTSCTKAEKEQLVGGRRYRWSVGQVVYVSDRLADLGKQ